MDRSLFLARLMGPTFVAVALGILINLGMYQSMIVEALHTGILFYLSGLLSLLAGLAIINLHNRWQADWRSIITVMGWLMTLGGIMRIVLPQVAVAIGSTVYSGRAATVVVALITGAIGAFLSFNGYVRRA
ncbi:hypothetical protein GGD66_003631 [Bradyrhizobium sp. CIR48]|uniref:hypothetical protein n=1 Tax=Bradyrhizobium sp. CIR48 TaxID=2663840 RepID=UPI0016055F3E|nr:hypothetical protein [Bradyrhizobium sp. CIR48]MBB4425074.1 hypothetical protein [Bradyrhizobium sp. CIR48]